MPFSDALAHATAPDWVTVRAAGGECARVWRVRARARALQLLLLIVPPDPSSPSSNSYCACLLAGLATCTQAEADEEPLALGGVVIDAPAAAALDAAWQQVQRTSLYGSPAAFRELVSQVGGTHAAGCAGCTPALPQCRCAPAGCVACPHVRSWLLHVCGWTQVLARDIRSLHQRVHVLPLQPAAAAAAAAALQQQQPRPEQEQPQQEPQRPAPPGGGTSTAPAASAAGTASDCEHRQPPQPLDAASRGRYVVVLDGVEVSYDVCSVSGRILVRGAAARAAAAARGRAGDV